MSIKSLNTTAIFIGLIVLLLNACTPLTVLEPTPIVQPTPTPTLSGSVPPEKSTAFATETMMAQTQTPFLAPTQTPEQGILEGIAPPFSTDRFWSGGNQWNGYVNNTFTIAYVGAYGNDRQQGVVVVVTESSEEWVNSPERNGTLTISSAEGTMLTLSSTEGVVYQFDLNAKIFLLATPHP
jgi:hypothetical protein